MSRPAPTVTWWKDVNDQEPSVLDPIVPDSPRYKNGTLPVGFILLLTNVVTGNLWGPIRFSNSEDAAKSLEVDKPTHFMIVPKPDSLSPG